MRGYFGEKDGGGKGGDPEEKHYRNIESLKEKELIGVYSTELQLCS